MSFSCLKPHNIFKDNKINIINSFWQPKQAFLFETCVACLPVNQCNSAAMVTVSNVDTVTVDGGTSTKVTP